MLLDLEGQSVLQQARYLLPVVAVPVAHAEEVAVPQVQHVRISEVSVLIYFIWVVLSDATFCREREFSDHVVHRVGVSGAAARLLTRLASRRCGRCFLSFISSFQWLLGSWPHGWLLRLCSFPRRWLLILCTINQRQWSRNDRSALLRTSFSGEWSLIHWRTLTLALSSI